MFVESIIEIRASIVVNLNAKKFRLLCEAFTINPCALPKTKLRLTSIVCLLFTRRDTWGCLLIDGLMAAIFFAPSFLGFLPDIIQCFEKIF